MRAYQLWNGGPWVDLDHILEIVPPVFSDSMRYGWYYTTLKIQFMFQDKPRVYEWGQAGIWNASTEDFEGPEMEGAIPSGQAKMHREVFEPLLRAWKGTQ